METNAAQMFAHAIYRGFWLLMEAAFRGWRS